MGKSCDMKFSRTTPQQINPFLDSARLTSVRPVDRRTKLGGREERSNKIGGRRAALLREKESREADSARLTHPPSAAEATSGTRTHIARLARGLDGQ